MLHKICIYNSKIFIVLDTYLIGYYYNKYSGSQDNHFKEYIKLKIPVKCWHDSELSLEVVNNHLTGLKTLIVLVFELKILCHVFLYNDSFRKKLYKITLPIGPVSIEDYHTRLFVSDGPSILFQPNNSIHLFSLPYRKTDTFDGLRVLSSKEYKILQFKCFGDFNTCSSSRFHSLLVILCNSSGKQNIKVAGFLSASGSLSSSFELLPLDLFFPRCYETFLKSVEVVKVVPHCETELAGFIDVQWKEIISVMCTKDEFLLFHNSALLYCCKLTKSVSDVMYMHSEFSCSSLENAQLVLKLENKEVFFIGLKKESYCEVFKQLNDFEVVLTEDILGKGSKQVLLLKESDLITWQSNCILYGMLSFLPIDLLGHNKVPEDGLITTISGLERIVQIGKSKYQLQEHEISQKSAAIIDALCKLEGVKENNELVKNSTFQESLVDVILSKDENKKRNYSTESKSSIKLLEKKQRFIKNHCVLNLYFKNDGEKCICNVNTRVLMQERQAACIEKLFVHCSEHFSPSDKDSCQINPEGRFTIQLYFELSAYFGDIDLILTWYDGSTHEFLNEIFANEKQKALLQHQFSLQTNITLSDVLDSHIKRGISSLCDVLFLRMSQQKTKLRISSLHSSINRLEVFLTRSNSPSKNFYFYENSSSRCLVFNNEVSSLFGVHILYNSSEQNILEMEAYAENEIQILVLIKYLYDNLPEDVIIFPEINFKEEFSQLKKEAAISMKDELDLILSSLSIYNISEKLEKNSSTLLGSQMSGTITIPKPIYNRIRRALVKKEYITDSFLKNFSYNRSH